MRTIYIDDKKTMRDRMMEAWTAVNQAIEGGKVVVEIKRPNKTRDMEKKYHAMIADIARQVKFDGRRTFSTDVWKARMVEQFAKAKSDMNEPLSSPGATVMSLDGERIIFVRPSTTQFKVKEGSEFIEYLYAEGTDMGVVWSDPVMEFYRELSGGDNA